MAEGVKVYSPRDVAEIGPLSNYTLYADYAKLEAEHAALKAKADKLASSIEAAMLLTPKHEGCSDTLEAALSEYREGKP